MSAAKVEGCAEGTSCVKDNGELETYLLLLLSDSNLPTGGFVASSGLESFFAHGLLHDYQPVSAMAHYGKHQQQIRKPSTAPSQAHLASATLSFAKSSLHSYCRSSLPFLVRVHAVVSRYLDRLTPTNLEASLQSCLDTMSWLDHSYHTVVLNHVARRASKAQGIALLTLYSKAFAKPIPIPADMFDGKRLGEPSRTGAHHETARITAAAQLIDRLKSDIRRSATLTSSQTGTTSTWRAKHGQHGHLPICWAVFSACLGISLPKALFLHLFLQARSLFSSSIRLNSLGPYLAHQIMRFQLRDIVNDLLDEFEPEAKLHSDMSDTGIFTTNMDIDTDTHDKTAPYSIPDQTTHEEEEEEEEEEEAPEKTVFWSTGSMVTNAALHSPQVNSLRPGKDGLIPVLDRDAHQAWAWDWPDDHTDQYLHPQSAREEPKSKDTGFWSRFAAPASTFPLGEIVQARHDQLHSRLFNS